MITNQWAKEITGDMVSVYLGEDDVFPRKMKYRKMDVEEGWDGNWYKAGKVPPQPEPTVPEKIQSLEAQITDRNVRGAILGDEYALNKLQSIEAQIAELRRQLGE